MACFIPCCTGWKTGAWCAAVGKRPTPAASGNILQFNRLAIGVTALTALVALVMAMAVIGRQGSSGASLLLATHAFVIILGYTMTLLIGGMGICFVSQRAFEDFPTSRLHSIARVSLMLGSVALFLTTIGLFLGMVWAKIEWGRYSSWD